MTRTPATDGERGSIAVELAICIPALIALVLLMVVFGRAAMARGHVDGAAFSAARAASIQRDSGQAQTAAAQAAAAYLDQRGLDCAPQRVSVDTSALTTAVGTSGSVTADVSCTISFRDLGGLIPIGSTTFDAAASSPVDTWRQR